MTAISRLWVLEKSGLLGAVAGSGGRCVMHWRRGCLGHHICAVGHLVNLFHDPLRRSTLTSCATPSIHSHTPTLPTRPPLLPPPHMPRPWNIPASHVVAGYPICPAFVYINLALALPTTPTAFHFLCLTMHAPFTGCADNWLQAHTRRCQNRKPHQPGARHNAHQSMRECRSHTSSTRSCCLHHAPCGDEHAQRAAGIQAVPIQGHIQAALPRLVACVGHRRSV